MSPAIGATPARAGARRPASPSIAVCTVRRSVGQRAAQARPGAARSSPPAISQAGDARAERGVLGVAP